MLGTLPEEKELSRIIRKAASLADACTYDVDNGLMVTKRYNGTDYLYIVASVGGKEGEFRFDGEYTDIISGDVYKGSLRLMPYELHVLKEH